MLNCRESADTGVAKRASDPKRFARPIIPFRNARTAFRAFLLAANLEADEEVLLPAYIGWSSNEGSGVFDPVLEIGVRYRFYRVARNLAIDLADLREKVVTGRPKVLLLIHYFGYPDRALCEIAEYARQNGILVVEDEAHALYSDWVGGVCGRFGDVAVMSLHKMLPFESGGMLVLNNAAGSELCERLYASSLQEPTAHLPLDYDLAGIAEARRSNAATLSALLQSLHGKVDLLHPVLPDGVVPQSLPVIINTASRDKVYFDMNNSGFGVVSLYHTLITAIDRSEFPDSYWLAQRILNLPVHQDIMPGQLEALVGHLEKSV